MGQLIWYRRFPKDALKGMMGLTLEERGAYNTILDLLYSRDGKLPDDDKFLCRWLGCDIRVWRRIKAALIDLERIYLKDGHIHCERADEELLVSLGRVEKARAAGKKSHSGQAEPDLFGEDLGDKFAGSSAQVSAKSDAQAQENNALGETKSKTELENEPKGSYPPLVPPALLSEWPDWLPIDAWNGFVAMRKAGKHPLTPRGVELALRELAKLRAEGFDPEAVLDQSTFKNWRGLFAPKDGDRDNGSIQGNRGYTAARGNQGDGFAQALDRSIASHRNGEAAGQAGRPQAGDGGGGGELPSAQIIALPSR